ncbi:helix-turn-helix domain-containing protein [Allokutzneria sp. A3M-2-11 16]|uniref:helix-turn-helix domain-containing protein n=1 Tax=Allokutzneria sp. A3M-2-11 16 TaxID=2962043 RepID=UPI0020B65EAD|nr:helix-turn-helix transcriptional regulator [Allokutzneria sp. A3M-2-11 16]MCP3803539.1 helix-turn-helix domain-containing protein [Allokutzneria sp. A3M-2-11 16]
MPGTRTRRKRKLGAFLKELRERAGIGAEEVAARLRKSQPTISKIENGHVLCGFAELGAMLALYAACEEQRREAEALWDDAKQDATRIEHSSAVPPKFRTFLRAEADATSVQTLESTGIPGLLQTADYAAAVRRAARGFSDPAVGLERAVAARLSRQKRLHGPGALTLHALIDEAVVRRLVGGPRVQREQLVHLLVAAEQDNITVQIIPFDFGAYGTMSGSATILGFADDGYPDAVYLEYPGGGEWVENDDDVRKFRATFADISTETLTPEESAAVIRAHVDALEGR